MSVRRTQIQNESETTQRVAEPGGSCGGAGTCASRLRHCARALALLAVLVLAGCGGGSGGGSGSSGDTEPAIQVDPVYLEPGVTSATLEWPASRGAVENYLVFESRNGSAFGYSTMTFGPSVQINGEAGDAVQVTVVAVSPNGQMSESSPPSAPIIFQAAPSVAAATAAPLASGAAPTAAPMNSETSIEETGPEPTGDDPALAAADTTETEATTTPTDAPTEESAGPEIAPLTADLRRLLLSGDTRLPLLDLSTSARSWLQARVDAEVGAGVSLVGTGRDDEDALLELVWQDQAGQLFVSDGAGALDASDLAAGFEEGPRLGATERFVGLADLDGDSVAEWLIEDTALQVVWVVDADTGLARAAEAIANDRLVGQGDFDGDGLMELLWQAEDGRLSLSRAAGDAAAPDLDAFTPERVELLAIADFDGDGRDDLLGLDDQGILAVGRATGPDDVAPQGFAWRDSGLAPLEGRELVATLDVDGDGAAELALLDGDSVETQPLPR